MAPSRATSSLNKPKIDIMIKSYDHPSPNPSKVALQGGAFLDHLSARPAARRADALTTAHKFKAEMDMEYFAPRPADARQASPRRARPFVVS